MKLIVNNVTIYAIECCLISNISDLLSSLHILQMNQEFVYEIATKSN